MQGALCCMSVCAALISHMEDLHDSDAMHKSDLSTLPHLPACVCYMQALAASATQPAAWPASQHCQAAAAFMAGSSYQGAQGRQLLFWFVQPNALCSCWPAFKISPLALGPEG